MALGYKHPRYLLADLTREEWLDWVAYHRVNPIGGGRYDFYIGLLRQTMAAVAGHGASLDDLTPRWGPDVQGDAEAEFLRRMIDEDN